MSRQPNQIVSAGFTLLEMLIVLALLGLLTVVLTSTIFLGITARARVTAVAMDQQDFSSFRRILELKLGRAYPDWIVSGQYRVVDFEGASDRLDFLAPALDVQGPGLAHYDLALGKTDGRPDIALQTTLAADGTPPTLTTYFAPGLDSVTFRYFGSPRDGVAPFWQNDWTMHTRLPDLIAIRVTFPEGDRRSWPELVIHPAIDADVTCEIDPATHDCAGR